MDLTAKLRFKVTAEKNRCKETRFPLILHSLFPFRPFVSKVAVDYFGIFWNGKMFVYFHVEIQRYLYESTHNHRGN